MTAHDLKHNTALTDPRDTLCLWPLIFHGQEVRTLIDERDKSFWAHAGDVGRLLGLVNIRVSVSRMKPAWRRGVTISDTTGRQQEMTFLSEQAIYKLAFSSTKPEAEEFTDRIAELLAKLRRGDLVLRPRAQGILEQTSERQQKDNSIAYNRQAYLEGGEDELRKRNGRLCQALSDKALSPTQLREWAKDLGFPSKDRTSGLQVLRRMEPWSACSISAAKNLQQMGMPWEESIDVGKELKSVYARILKYGTPKELEPEQS